MGMIIIYLGKRLFVCFCFMSLFFTTAVSAGEVSIQDKLDNSTKAQDIIVTMIGDCTLGNDVNFGYEGSLPAYYDANDDSYFFRNVANVFKKSDITVANLETAFTLSDSRADKTFAFKGDPAYAGILKAAGITAVNLSNNHIYDYSQEGFKDTIAALQDAQIGFFGEGYVYSCTVKQNKIVCLGYMGWYATEDALAKLQQDINKARMGGANHIIVSFHWGVEKDYSPDYDQKTLAHYAIDYGADIVWGHHPHVLQGIEKYNNKFIFYSLGNFCFGGNINPKDKDTIIAQVKITKDGSQHVRIIPVSISSVTWINDYSPVILSGEDGERVLNKLKKLSSYTESFNQF